MRFFYILKVFKKTLNLISFVWLSIERKTSAISMFIGINFEIAFSDPKYFSDLNFSTDGREYALKQIEGTGISMSACREIAVSNLF